MFTRPGNAVDRAFHPQTGVVAARVCHMIILVVIFHDDILVIWNGYATGYPEKDYIFHDLFHDDAIILINDDW
jgi:hypothetical protein